MLLVNERPGLIEMSAPSKLTTYFEAGRPIVAATEPTSITAEEIERSGAGIRVAPGRPSAILEAVLRSPGHGRRGSHGFRGQGVSP